MIKKIIALCLSLLTFCFIFTSCAGGEGEDLYYPLYSDPVSFDPQIAADNASKIVVFNCFEGLVRTDKEGNIIPGVAKSWEVSEDGFTYTFHLRADSKWYMSEYAKKLLPSHTAESFNYTVIAEDFVYGFERAFDKSMGSVSDSRLFAIKNSRDVYSGEMSADELGVTALDNHTLKIELEEPHEDFLFALTQSAAMPCREEFFLATKGRYGLDPEKVIYNGPFYLYSWSVGSNLVLFKNENYKGEAQVKPNAVYLYINNDSSSRVSKLLDGTYDACPLSVRQKALIDDDDITYLDYTNSTWGFSFNCESESMSNYNMRTALTASLDTYSLPLPQHCESYSEGIVPDICLVGGSTYRARAGKVKMPDVDTKKAQKNLELAFETLEIDNVKITVICDENFESTIKLAVQSWQKALGVHVSFVIEPLSESELDLRYKSGNYDIAFTKVTSETESALSFLGMFTTDSITNYFNFSSKTYDSLLINHAETLTQAESVENCIKAEQYLIDSCVFIPVFSEESYLALADDVSEVYAIDAGAVPIFINGLRK